MTNKEFVKKHKPTAWAERHKENGPLGKTYWLICERGQYMYFAEGSTQAIAWGNAANIIRKYLLENEQSEENKTQD